MLCYNQKITFCFCQQSMQRILKRTFQRKREFTDRVRLLVKGGSGGMGYPSTGGIGGNGGSIAFESKEHVSLSQFSAPNMKRLTGELGQNCRRGKAGGKHGKHKKYLVPPGTIITCTEDGVLADLDKPHQKVTAVKGGIGGRPFNDFNGQKGERRLVVLELKLIADIGLVGYPNAGKSTLLCNISKAKPKIGNYPFTTVRPTIGSIFYDKQQQLTVADLPGLIEGAHVNKGMGHRFLRHIERTKGILVLVDVNGFQIKMTQPRRTPLETLCHLLKELYLYEKMLLTRPTVLALNKVDDEKLELKFQAAKQSILDATEDDIWKILGKEDLASPVFNKVREICEDDGNGILRLSTKFGVGFDELKETLYHIGIKQQGDNITEEDYGDHENDIVDGLV